MENGMINKMTAGRIIRFGMTALLFFSLLQCKKNDFGNPEKLVVGISRDWRVSDVWSHKGFNCLIFQTLVTRDKKGSFIPSLAEKWEKSKNGLSYTFTIKKGIKFSDGTALTSRCVKESFTYREKARQNKKKRNRPVNRKIYNANAGTKGRKGKSKYGDFSFNKLLPRWSPIKTIKIIDDHTLTFILKRPYTLFLDDLAATHISPILKPSKDERVTGFIGTGPYKIGEHVRTRHITLKSNQYHWQGKAGIPELIFKVIPDPQTRSLALEAGDIDMTGIDHFDKISRENVIMLRKSGFAVKKPADIDPSLSYLVLNYRKPPFNDPGVRKAVKHAVDMKAINRIIHETARCIHGPIPESHPLYNQNIERTASDISKAKRLLKKAGWEDRDNNGIREKKGKELSVTLSLNYFDPHYKIIGEIIQAQLKEVGFDIKLRMLELGAHVNGLVKNRFQMAFWPQMRYHMFYYTRNKSWLNLYNNPQLDEYFYQYLYSNIPSQREKAHEKTQQIIYESNVMPLYFESFSIVAWNRKKLRGFEPMPLGWNLCMNLWKAKITQ